MVKLEKLNVIAAIALNNTSYLDQKPADVFEDIKSAHDTLNDRWKASNRTDFSIYQDPLYAKAAIHSYFSRTNITHGTMLKWLLSLEGSTDFEIFDEYNGAGITTLQLIQCGFEKTAFMNDNECQLEIFKRLCDHYGVKFPVNDRNREKMYDLVLSYETAEHFQEPEEYINKLIDMVKPGMYLGIAHSFNWPDAAGHFTEYRVRGKVHDNKTATRAVNALIRDRCESVFRGWNNCIRIYQRKS